MTRSPLRAFLVGALFVGAAACSDAVTPTQLDPDEARFGNKGESGPTIADIAVAAATAENEADREFTILVQALQAADLVGALDGRRQFTVFAPTDAAFGRLLALLDVTAEDLLADTELLKSVLLYHVAPGRRLAEDVLDSDQIRTLNGGFVFPILTDDGAFIVDGSAATADAPIVTADIEASNGVIHVIDEVLVPGDESRPGKGEDDEDDDDGDEDGDEDEEGEDELTIAGLVSALASDEENPQFTILLAAVQAAGFVDFLDGDRDLTVFAPTDAAFGRLLDLLGVSAEDLLADTQLLQSVLRYHIAPGERDAEDVLGSTRIRTLQGSFLFPAVTDAGPVIIDGSDATADAPIIATDIEVENGIVHVIDEVLLFN